MSIAEPLFHKMRQWLDSDLLHDFKRDPGAFFSAIILLLIFAASALAPLLASQDPHDLRQLSLLNAMLPPVWMQNGQSEFLLGTDDQGRDLRSAMLYGARISLLVGFLATASSILLGVTLGLIAGFAGGRTDAFIMRVADIQLSFPAILIAMLIDGAARAILQNAHSAYVIPILIGAIALSNWVEYARTVRGLAMSERNKEYVQSARVTGVSSARIARRHILPNVLGPVFVLATINVATAILAEATLSFLGVGVPPSAPSLGTLVNIGNEFLFSGAWWIAVFPGALLVVLILSINLLGDWLRDALNPRLK